MAKGASLLCPRSGERPVAGADSSGPAEQAGVGESSCTWEDLRETGLQGGPRRRHWPIEPLDTPSAGTCTHLTRDFTAPIPIPDPQWGTDNT